MNKATIIQKLHNYLEIADDKKIKAIYTMVEQAIQSAELIYTEEFKEELNKRNKAYSNNPSNGINQEESKSRIAELLKQCSYYTFLVCWIPH